MPQTMQRAMARQAEAERERRAKIIHAEGEFQASEKLATRRDDRPGPGRDPAALPADADRDRRRADTTIVFPLPIDLVKPFFRAAQPTRNARRGDPSATARRSEAA